jgi:hypothetical protein
MKKFTSLLIGCSLALAGAAMAQQPEEQPTPKGKKQEKTQSAEAKPGAKANASNPEATVAKERGAGNQQGAGKGKRAQATEKSEKTTGAETNVSGEPGAGASVAPGVKERGKGKNARGTNAMTSPSMTPATATASAPPNVKERGKGKNASATTASVAPTVAPTGVTGQTNATTNTNVAATGAATTHVEKEKVQQVKQQTAQIKQQHVNFKAQPRPDKVPAVTFNASYRLEGSDRWQGPQYEVYRSYHPERHDRGWYSSHYSRVELIGGGYYYWNNGYWYPAWGYDSGNEYYAYDAPIYVGHRAEPPDRVIADVQTELQQMGYYQGEVDGLLGPLTREALTAYQADQGLMTTAVIDEPTLDSLDMG